MQVIRPKDNKTGRPDMKKVIVAVICAVMVLGVVALANAERGEWRGGICERIHKAKERIADGIEQGSLTRHEAKKLERELDRILEKIDRMKEDGQFSPRERKRINYDLDRLERHITREKHDEDTRDGYRDHRRR
jgi:septal ring factor EnvC (AmiA/AmiB activator)